MDQLKSISITNVKSLYELTFKGQRLSPKYEYKVMDAPGEVVRGDNKVSVSVKASYLIKDSAGKTEKAESSRYYDVMIQSYEDTPCDVRSISVSPSLG